MAPDGTRHAGIVTLTREEVPKTKAAIYCHTSYRAGAALAAQEDRCRRLALRLGADEIVTITDAGPCPRARASPDSCAWCIPGRSAW